MGPTDEPRSPASDGAPAEERHAGGSEVRGGLSPRTKHDLMQPLAAITNYAELIRMQSSDAPQRHATEIVRLAAELASAIRSLP